ncbi:unnamed protein product, partial [Ectocarpus sp. 12 AP-2014]
FPSPDDDAAFSAPAAAGGAAAMPGKRTPSSPPPASPAALRCSSCPHRFEAPTNRPGYAPKSRSSSSSAGISNRDHCTPPSARSFSMARSSSSVSATRSANRHPTRRLFPLCITSPTWRWQVAATQSESTTVGSARGDASDDVD